MCVHSLRFLPFLFLLVSLFLLLVLNLTFHVNNNVFKGTNHGCVPCVVGR